MRILYVSKALASAVHRDKVVGLARYADVTAVVPNRWQPHAPERSADTDSLIRWEPVWLPGSNHFHVYPAAAALLDETRPDLVHIDEEPYSTATWHFTRLCRNRGIPSLFFAWQNLAKRLPPPFHAMRRYVFNTASGAIAGTPDALDVLRRLGYRGRAAVIPQFGVNLERFYPDSLDRTGVRAAWGVMDQRFVVGFVGRLVPEKGVQTLVEAIARLPDTQLVVIGEGSGRKSLEDRAVRLACSHRMRFLGSVPTLDVGRLLRGLDLLVLPSRTVRGWSEQFGRVLVEAMATGVPVVATRTGAIPWVVDDAAVLVPPNAPELLAQAIRGLMGRPEQYRTLAGRGRDLVATRFATSVIVQRTLDWYEALLGHGAKKVVRV